MRRVNAGLVRPTLPAQSHMPSPMHPHGGNSSASDRFTSSSHRHRSPTDNPYEDENGLHDHGQDRHFDGLRERVSILKEISIGIGDELDEQKKFLHGFDEDLSATGNLLDGTMKRFRRMAATQNGCMTLWFAGFVFGTFTFMYFYVKYIR